MKDVTDFVNPSLSTLYYSLFLLVIPVNNGMPQRIMESKPQGEVLGRPNSDGWWVRGFEEVAMDG
jgi:hypothetical protein